MQAFDFVVEDDQVQNNTMIHEDVDVIQFVGNVVEDEDDTTMFGNTTNQDNDNL